jgi:hypothetical protein
MIPHKPSENPSTIGSPLPKALTRAALSKVDVIYATKNYWFARRDFFLQRQRQLPSQS